MRTPKTAAKITGLRQIGHLVNYIQGFQPKLDVFEIDPVLQNIKEALESSQYAIFIYIVHNPHIIYLKDLIIHLCCPVYI